MVGTIAWFLGTDGARPLPPGRLPQATGLGSQDHRRRRISFLAVPGQPAHGALAPDTIRALVDLGQVALTAPATASAPAVIGGAVRSWSSGGRAVSARCRMPSS
jgi:hypothetical protein